jgi:putative CocE/NonD family hydrolase
MRNIGLLFSLAWAVATPIESVLAQDAPIPSLEWGVKIPMRDGVRLNATVYRPTDAAEPTPVVFTMTPYISDSYHDRAMYFSQHGYAFVLVDVRGRGSSEGSFEPFANDPRDGYDVVEWLAQQPWSDGQVTMWGGSYAGYNQCVMQWLTFTSGVTGQGNLFGERSFWIDKFTQLYEKHLPFNVLDSVVGNMTTVFQKWLEHPTPDAYWDSMAPTVEQYRNIDVPILTITGHYDGDQLGAMEYYRRHMRYGNERAVADHYLIIGPWDHAGTRTPRREVGGLTFGEASVLDLNDLHRQWYDWTMKDGPSPEFLEQRVAYYVVGPGAEHWKYARNLEEISDETMTMYLWSLGDAADPFASGRLVSFVPQGTSHDAYTNNPFDAGRAALEQEPSREYLTDQTQVLSLDGDGLIYHSAPFTEATEISGFVELSLWMAIDVPDTDFLVTLYEILQDGTSVQLTSDMQRARYRESLRQERLVTPGQINEYTFDSFQFFSRMIAEGSRVRLVVTSPNSINLQKNYNAGGVVAEESGRHAKTATVAVYHDREHPSQLRLPIVRQ